MRGRKSSKFPTTLSYCQIITMFLLNYDPNLTELLKNAKELGLIQFLCQNLRDKLNIYDAFQRSKELIQKHPSQVTQWKSQLERVLERAMENEKMFDSFVNHLTKAVPIAEESIKNVAFSVKSPSVKLGNLLGWGAQAKVYKGLLKDDNGAADIPVAVKVYDDDSEKIENELSILQKLKDVPYVSQLLWWDSAKLALKLLDWWRVVSLFTERRGCRNFGKFERRPEIDTKAYDANDCGCQRCA